MAEGEELYRSWTVDQLKTFLREWRIPLAGNKAELVKKVTDIAYTDRLEEEIEATTFQCVEYAPPPNFEQLPSDGWTGDDFPLVREIFVTDYLKARGGYTKNFRTGVRLCQCSHLFDLEMVKSGTFTYIKAKCRPTMRKDPPFYSLFTKLQDGKPVAGNCKCPAGETQTCVHVAALLITLTEITPQACTSVRCAWSRPTQGGKPSFAVDLDFGNSSVVGYVTYTGPVLEVNDLLHQLESAGCDTGAQHYFKQEEDRSLQSVPPPSANPVLIDPLDKLRDIASTRDVTVNDLVEALKPTAEEVELIQAMSVGQQHNPLWLDARQWRVTSSNFGRVCNRTFRHLYPPSLVKSVLGDYGMPHTAPLQWGCDHESDAIQQYMLLSGLQVEDCGVFLSEQFPYLATSPDGIIPLGSGKFGVVEAKCPYKHRKNSIEVACKDTAFCLSKEDGQIALNRRHDYYFQVTGQLALTSAEFCDFVVWTEVDIHIERIQLDVHLWTEMKDKLSHFYYTTLGAEVLDRLCNM